MSKRGQQPPLQRRKVEPPAPEPEGRRIRITREFRSRKEREDAVQRWFILGTAITVGIVAVILVIAFVIDRFVIPNQVVATVAGENINVGQFEQRVRFERAVRNEQLNQAYLQFVNFGLDPNQLGSQEPYATWLRELQIPEQLGSRIIDEMVEEQLIRNEAEARGITVSEADVQAQINRFFGFDADQVAAIGQEPTATPEPSVTPTPFVSPTPSPEPSSTPTSTPNPEATDEATEEATAEATAEATSDVTPTMLPTIPPTATLSATEITENFNTQRNDFFSTIRNAAGVSDADINNYFEYLALRQAVRDAVTDEDESMSQYMNARHILVGTEPEAQDVLAALEAGESFADLAVSVSLDEGSGANGGDLGWALTAQYVEPFANAARDAEIGAFVGPIETEFGFHIIQVRAREDRELEETELENARDRSFFQWLDERQTAAEDSGEAQIFSTWTEHVPSDPPLSIGA
ncbi:MAG: peptidylprolyl isomerase [Burkholderiales bacterium]|nr:peptidylprolyl isomerase [Anaerolineae bacterium]